MKKNRIHYFIIGGNFILAVVFYAYVALFEKGNGYEGYGLILLSYSCMTFAIIYLILFLLVYIFLQKELKEETKIDFKIDQTITELRKKISIKLLTISLIAYFIDFIAQISWNEHNDWYTYLLSLIKISALILSGWRMVKGSKIFKIISLVVLFSLLSNSIGNLSRYFFLGQINKDEPIMSVFVTLIVAIAYLYVINIILKSKLFRNEKQAKSHQ